MMCMKKYNIAILGATGLVGKTFLKVLEEMDLPINTLKLFASKRSLGKEITFKGKNYLVDTVKEGSFKGIDYALFSAGGNVSKKYAPQAVEEGAIVIDNSSAFRMDVSYPLVVPEVNLLQAKSARLIANPNCSTIQSVLPIYPLDKAFKALEITYNTYQAVSGSGYKGLEALEGNNTIYPYDPKKTCIPQIGDFLEDGYTFEEEKMILETKKILSNKDLKVTATCIRVPVKFSHGVSIRVKFEKPFEMNDVRSILSSQSGLELLGQEELPVSQLATNNNKVYVGRLRRDRIDPNTLLLYCVADNVRKGAAANAVQIMKGLIDNA